jgi:pyruvate decarboxylase
VRTGSITTFQIGSAHSSRYIKISDQLKNRNWTKLLEVFGGVEGETSQSYTVYTKDELDKLLRDEAFARTERIQLVEVMMEQLDAPRVLKVWRALSEMRRKANANIAQGTATA